MLQGAELLLAAFAFLVLPLAALVLRKRRTTLIWGVQPVINNKYWSHAMSGAGWQSHTLVSSVYSTINDRRDFDLLFDDLVPGVIRPRLLRNGLAPYFAFLHVLRRAKVLHISFRGGPLGQTHAWRLEGPLLRWAGIRTVIIPYGGDVYMYSRVQDPTVRNGLLRSYPDAGRREDGVVARVNYWCRRASLIINGFTLDGVPRWDVLVANAIVVDKDLWLSRTSWSRSDGRDGRVRVLHAPNHRGVKGTDFVIEAVDQLREEGLDVELVLVERMQNTQMRAVMESVDILADQLILPGYGLAAIEGMASGLPVVCNLDHPGHTSLFDRYSYLGECPVVSSTPETVLEDLRTLVVDPSLREKLGRAGRQYVEKYHAYETAQYLFGALYNCLFDGAQADLMTLFDPRSSQFNKHLPRVSHPLENHHVRRVSRSRAMPFDSVRPDSTVQP